MRRRTFRGAVAVMALTTAALIGTAGSALACWSPDDRSNPVPDRNHSKCADNQDKITPEDNLVDFTGGVGQKTLTITKVHDGVTVNRIIVQGGDDGFNEYIPGKNRLSPKAPWKDLKPTLTSKRQETTIDKWFICGKKPTETTKPPTTKPTETQTTKPSAPASSETVAPASTTAAAVVPAGNESGTGGGLANTGFDNMWLVWIAGLLILGGGGLLALLKFRRKASE